MGIATNPTSAWFPLPSIILSQMTPAPSGAVDRVKIGRLLGGNHSQLLHHAKIILITPMLHYFTVGESKYMSLSERYFLSGVANRSPGCS